MLSTEQIQEFQKKIYDFYKEQKRDFLWRRDITPYKIFISEIMLQQTQTARVTIKFQEWFTRFPDFASVAEASSADILYYWQGLGYNRRALAIQQAAQHIEQEWHGVLPNDPALLMQLKGIGPNTAGSICAFAFNRSIVFIETNIRAIFLHQFFQGESSVSDQQILTLVESTLDHENPRDWYYALMDYGVYLKKVHKVRNLCSRHYKKQSKFQGSRRQIRGAIVRILTKNKRLCFDDLCKALRDEYDEISWDISEIIDELVKERFLKKVDDSLLLL